MTARAAAITGAAAAAVLVAVGLVVARGDDSAPVRGCRERIEGPRTIMPERADTVIGPIALGALPATYRDLASRPADWERVPRYGMPAFKAMAVLRAGARVTRAGSVPG
jgi:hypothetical protein